MKTSKVLTFPTVLSMIVDHCLYMILHIPLASKSRIVLRITVIYQAPVVQTMDSAIHRINHYPADKH